MTDWTQPICDRCFGRLYPGVHSAKLVTPEREQCCMCGEGTASGIYIRIDPKTVPYPSTDADTDS